MGDTIFLDISKKKLLFLTITTIASACFLVGTLVGFFVGLLVQSAFL